MKKQLLISLVTFGVCFLNVSSALAYGALAIDSNQGKKYGFSYGYETSEEANAKALKECGDNCSIVQTFSNGCAAFAADQAKGSSVYGFASGYEYSSDAQSLALDECRSRGGKSCIVRVWGCDKSK